MEVRKVKLKKPMPATDFSDKPLRFLDLQVGVYQVEKISNPSGLGVPWLVIKGTKIGAAEMVWEEYLENGKEKRDDLVSNDDAKRVG